MLVTVGVCVLLTVGVDVFVGVFVGNLCTDPVCVFVVVGVEVFVVVGVCVEGFGVGNFFI